MTVGADDVLPSQTHSSHFPRMLLCTTLLTLFSQLPHLSSPTPFLGFPPSLSLQHCASWGTGRTSCSGRTKEVREVRMRDTGAGELIENWSRLWNLTVLSFTIVCAILRAWLFLNENLRNYLSQRWLCLKLELLVIYLEGQNYLGLLQTNQSRVDKLAAVLRLWRLKQLWL